MKKLLALLLALSMTASLTACKGNKDTTSEPEETKAAETTEAPTTVPETTETTETTTSAAADMVKVYYGWGSSSDEEKYTAEIHCPAGAAFDESTLEEYEEDGSVISAYVMDEANGYRASSVMHWHRDAYTSEPTAYPIIAQLYFDGKLDEETAAENSGCSQEVTPLGFQWNGYDVLLIETTYTFLDYGEQTDVFVGVEYDLDYWKTEEGTGTVNDLTTKALFGFDMYSLGWEDLTQEQCAWIAGELFGVDSGVSNPFLAEDETTEPSVNINTSALLGTWVDLESDWEDTYLFNADGTGCYTSGLDYTFTYTVEGDTLEVFYAEDDIDTFTISLEGDKLVLVDEFSYEQTFTKAVPTEEMTTEAETTEAAADENPNAEAIVGTWTEYTTGVEETFTFHADGTGEYCCLTDSGLYECGFTYEFFRSDYIDIYYDDGDEGGFQLTIDENKMTIRNDYVWDLVYKRTK